MSPRCDLLRVSLGAYALGGLDRDEDARVEAHLRACAPCRRELAEIEQVRDMLAAVPSEDAEALGAGTPQRRVPAASWLRRPAVRVAAALAVALVALAVGAEGTTRGPVPARLATASATDPATRVAARVVLRARPWGTVAVLHLRGVRPHARCRLVVIARDGRRDTAATWRATYEGAADVSGATATPLDAIAALEVVAERQGRLVRLTLASAHAPA